MIINQLLYGYNQGHSLLSASIKLAQEDRDMIQQLSDWSDFQNFNNELSYISGFPLEKSDCYAVSKTWYANEMQRPGCAWTHVLLIDKNDFTSINNIDFILGLFSRPNIDNAYDEYSNYIEFDLPEKKIENDYNTLSDLVKENYNSILDFDLNAIKGLLFSIYNTNNPIYITPNNSNNNSIEYLFLRIWWMQHLKFRFVFTFCTGTSMPRKYLNRTFDLQVLSSSNYKSSCLDLNNLRSNDINEALWLNKLGKELISNKTSFITFLNRFSYDISVERNRLINLVNIYQTIENGLINTNANDYINNLVDDLADYFPSCTEGAKLKEVLLRKEIISSFYDDSSFISLMCSTNKSSAFDFESINILNRSVDIYINDNNVYFQLLDELRGKDINDFGVKLLSYAATKIENKDITILRNSYWNLFVTFLRLNFKISSYDDCWNGTMQQNVEIVNILFRSEYKEDINWKNVLYSILSNELILPDSQYNQIRTLIPNYISVLLDWHNSQRKVGLSSVWILRLKQYENEILNWIEDQNVISFDTLKLIVKVVNPNSNNVIRKRSSLWTPFLHLNINSNIDIDVHMFFTAVAFNFKDEYAFRLLKKSFIHVYIAFSENNLGYSHIYDVLYHTKPLKFWQEWDNCKKLRNALADKSIEAKWNYSSIKEIVRNDLLANTIYDLCKKRK